MKIYDALGKVVVEKMFSQQEDLLAIGDGLEKGVYFARLEVDNLVSQTIKLVKQ